MPAEIYYYTDFTLCQSRTFETTKKFYLDEVVDSDGNRSSYRSLSEGVRFEVIGETDYLWLVCYEDSYYCVWKSNLDEYAREVLADTEVPDAAD